MLVSYLLWGKNISQSYEPHFHNYTNEVEFPNAFNHKISSWLLAAFTWESDFHSYKAIQTKIKKKTYYRGWPKFKLNMKLPNFLYFPLVSRKSLFIYNIERAQKEKLGILCTRTNYRKGDDFFFSHTVWQTLILCLYSA